jgi:hypothetical protein
MSSPVLELQQLATDSQHDIGDLLRKAKLVASKLRLDQFREWLDHELNGYGSADVPEYRKARAELRAKNPYHGLIPLVIEDPRIADAICNVEIRDPLSSLIHLLANHSSDRSSPIIPLTPQQTSFLMEGQGYAALTPVRTIAINKLAAIIDSVRTTILEWALTLEEQGIIGEGIRFSDAERDKAAASTGITIGNFQGILGNVSDSSIMQSFQMDVRRGDFESLKQYLKAQKVSDEDIQELETALKADGNLKSAGTFGERVGGWIGKLVSKAASGAWQVGVSTSSNLLAAGIRAYYGY